MGRDIIRHAIWLIHDEADHALLTEADEEVMRINLENIRGLAKDILFMLEVRVNNGR